MGRRGLDFALFRPEKGSIAPFLFAQAASGLYLRASAQAERAPNRAIGPYIGIRKSPGDYCSGLFDFQLEVSARFFGVGDPAAEGGQVVFVPALGGREFEGVLGVVPDVEEEVKDALLCPGERDAIGEADEIGWFEIRRQILVGHLVGYTVE